MEDAINTDDEMYKIIYVKSKRFNIYVPLTIYKLNHKSAFRLYLKILIKQNKLQEAKTEIRIDIPGNIAQSIAYIRMYSEAVIAAKNNTTLSGEWLFLYSMTLISASIAIYSHICL